MGIEIERISDAKLNSIAKQADVNKDKKLSGDEYQIFAQEASKQGYDYKTISETLDMNAFERWWFDVDKVSTDGKDDGKLSFGEKMESFGKGIAGIVKGAVKHPLVTAATIGAGALLTAVTGGAALPIMVALGAGTGAVLIGKGAYDAANAKTDAEAKAAWEGIGSGTFALAGSALGAKSALKTAYKAGVTGAKGAENMNIAQATLKTFKTIPEALKVSKNQIVSKYLGVTYTSYTQGGARIAREDINTINSTVDEIVDDIVRTASQEGRTLSPAETQKIQTIRTAQQQMIQDAHDIAKNYSPRSEIKFYGAYDRDYGRSTGLTFADSDLTMGYRKHISWPDEYHRTPQDIFNTWQRGINDLKGWKYPRLRPDIESSLNKHISEDLTWCLDKKGNFIPAEVNARKASIKKCCEAILNEFNQWDKAEANYVYDVNRNIARFEENLTAASNQIKSQIQNEKIASGIK